MWKGDTFLGNDGEARSCDTWVVLDDIANDEETALVQSGRAVLLTLEPPLTRDYRPKYLAQFDLVVSCHRNLRHPNVRNEYQGQTWHIGMHKGASAVDRQNFRGTMGYDELLALQPPAKSANISVICSASTRLPGHRARRAFVDRLLARLGDRVGAFGRGVRPIPDKADAIIPYRYHIALENSRLRDYWTEKLADSYLGWAFPIYWGCENVDDYLPGDSLIKIDIGRPSEAIDTIESVMEQELTPERMAALAEARSLVLDRYNTFDVIRRHCAALPLREPREITLRPMRAFAPSGLQKKATKTLRRIAAHFQRSP